MASKASAKRRLSPEDRRALLEDAARTCMARGGIREFTVDKVVAEAGVSRGLIIHHFGSMDGLLVAVYARMYGEWNDALRQPRPGLNKLESIVEALISPDLFARDTANVWLTLWGEVANNPVLREAHRSLYSDYRATLAAAIAETATANGRSVDAEALASAFICLVDGFGVQRCVDPSLLTEEDARRLCWAFLRPQIGGA